MTTLGESRGSLLQPLRPGFGDFFENAFEALDREYSFAIPNVQVEMAIRGVQYAKLVEPPPGIAFSAEESGSEVVIDAGHRESQPGKVGRDFRANQTAGNR